MTYCDTLFDPFLLSSSKEKTRQREVFVLSVLKEITWRKMFKAMLHLCKCYDNIMEVQFKVQITIMCFETQPNLQTHWLKSYRIPGICNADALINTHDMSLRDVSPCHAISTATVWDWLLGAWTGGRVSLCEWSSFLAPAGAKIRAGGWAGCASPERSTKLRNICWGVHHQHSYGKSHNTETENKSHLGI